MSGPLHPVTIRLTARARDVLQAIAADCGGGEGRAASELMELALTGRARPDDPRLTRKATGAASSTAMAEALQAQQGRVLASLRAAVARRKSIRNQEDCA